MEQTQIELDLVEEYQASLNFFKNNLKENDFKESDIELFEMIFEMGYQSGTKDVVEKIKTIADEYEATDKVGDNPSAQDS
jgi:hypothetical protein